MSRAVMEARSRRLGLQHGNSVDRAVFLSKGQTCRGVLPNEDLPDQKCLRLVCRRCWSKQDSAHSTVKRIDCYFEQYSLWHWEPMKRHEGLAWCVRIWSRQDSAHSTVKRIDCYFEQYSLWHWEPMKRHEGPAWCVRICQHRQPDERQRLGPSEVDGWLLKRHRIERRCSNQLDWRWTQHSGISEHLLVVYSIEWHHYGLCFTLINVFFVQICAKNITWQQFWKLKLFAKNLKN